jgi:hypothetical protein
VPSYPIEAQKLLFAADLLVPQKPGRGRPSYAAHRRGVSTAYYAVFHAVSARVAEQVFPNMDPAFRNRVRRWIGHSDIRTVAAWVARLQGTLGGSAPGHIAALLAPGGTPHVDADTAVIADGFLELHDKREQADYDHEAVFSRSDTLGHIALARQVVDIVETVDSDEARRFFGLVAMQARVQAR